ncbi:MAG: redox-sensing transcriptional repressor Rex [Phycisphaerae bacterium]
MAKPGNVPIPTVRRLSLYLRQLERLNAAERRTISSKALGEALNLSDAQVRKDLAYFGQFGYPGIGYRVPELMQRVRRILGTDKRSNVLLVGTGNLGRALIAYRGFTKKGFEVVAAFDHDRAKVGTRVSAEPPVHVLPMDQLPAVVRRASIRHGIIAVPADAAQTVADHMVTAGIRAILNFAPVTLHVRHDIAISSVDLAVHLEQLSFQVSGRSR